MMTDTEHNGKSEKIGELRGELRSLIREFQELREEIRNQTTSCRECQSQQQRQSADLATQVSNHIIFHRANETAHAEQAGEMTALTAGARWSLQLKLMAAGIFLSFGLGVVTLWHSWH